MLTVWLLVLRRILHLIKAVVSVVVVMAMRRFPSVFSKPRRDGHRQQSQITLAQINGRTL